MNKKNLIERISDKTGKTKTIVSDIVEEMIEIITKELKTGKNVRLVGFGMFEVRDRKGRTGRNPRTGQKIEISKTKTPAFIAGKALKDAVKGR
ncbi:MAG: DNA-binding protein [Candidatus Margulisiibacteriota bacterium]|nr:MAG: DNA-binding protein [Candidatus Margulisbacteria bacterium GWD2_39_127]OGI02142.1 MAG: DNA-binding protein [Candidatus Margulisbacteria bacterium GWF2_38_17]OGI10518.1 MAG: DNA-binding protein [Candidatus Margulisbacteria bacterium GWE2_39_32]PZM79934.1 MAG: DNA-binding protein [Candidatus Margulisiibacteriota bacterium]HAR62361.1 DNA-binding protein [Candidatus Margulisiibacteriota bacterium]